jgi:uncharacterized iron-regulated protein
LTGIANRDRDEVPVPESTATRSRVLLLLIFVALQGCATPRAHPDQSDVERLFRAMDGKRYVLLGEVHDNPTQHALRIQALRRLVAAGARPALAFEQFDRERQPDIDRARRERPRDADHLIASARPQGDGWDWKQYYPFVQLALDNDMPIVAANLSRTDAMRVAREGFGAVFDADRRRALGLDAIPEDFLQAHEQAIDQGHCRMLPAKMLPAIARAQIARDLVLAQSLRSHADSGVVLLTGNGHARNDIGVPYWLSGAERRETISIGLLERNAEPDGGDDRFDARFVTAPASRGDPCSMLRHGGVRLPASVARSSVPGGRLAQPQ